MPKMITFQIPLKISASSNEYIQTWTIDQSTRMQKLSIVFGQYHLR